MKKTVLMLLYAFWISGIGYLTSQTIAPITASYFEVSADFPDRVPDLLLDWHLGKPLPPKFCFGLCPDAEPWP